MNNHKERRERKGFQFLWLFVFFALFAVKSF